MANTLKFGNGEWYGKEGTILAYNSENNNYKPLPFDFSRASSATRVNKQGLIETVGADQPRVDYLNDSNGALLLEPSRTNSVPYSNDFNQHSILGGSITSDNITSPDGGVNSDTFVEDTANSQHRIREDISVTDGTYTMSVFIKGTDRFISLYPQSAGIAYAVFDIENAAITKTGGSDYVDSKIENYGNGWYRCILTYNVSTGTSFLHIYLSDKGTGTAAEAPTYTGDGSEMSFYGLQAEQGGYATSIIKTQGSSVTRVAEQGIDGGAGTPIFSNTSAVWFIDLERIGVDTDSSGSAMALRNSSFSQQIRLHFDAPTTNIRFRDALNGFATISTITGMSAGVRKKIALRIDGSALSTFANGSKIGSDYTAPSTFDIDEIDFSTLGFKIHDMRFYNEALTDQELINLTKI